MSRKTKLFLIFLILNFGGLALGNLFMNNGPTSTWYTNLNKASWTPPGWVFGVAWTTIMVCFSYYLALQFNAAKNLQKLVVFFGLELLLNVSWNYIFFNQHMVFLGLVNLVLLTALLFYYFFKLSNQIKKSRALLIPYMIWLCIATSLNLYIFLYN